MQKKGSTGQPDESAQKRFSDRNGHHSDSIPLPSEQIDELGMSMLSGLREIIEGDLIPRLMLAVDSPRKESGSAQAAERLRDSVDEFVQLLLAHDASIASGYISTLRSDGIPLQALYLDLLAPAARRLGAMWEADECSFTDVTIGVCRMHQVVLEFSRCFDAPTSSRASGKNVLIVTVPGEQHTFGIFMVMEFLRKDGWNCFGGNPANLAEFQRLLPTQNFDAVGISVSADRHLDTARDMIREVRSDSRYDDLILLTGGRAFVEQPQLAIEMGADATASDGEIAARELKRLMKSKQRHID